MKIYYYPKLRLLSPTLCPIDVTILSLKLVYKDIRPTQICNLLNIARTTGLRARRRVSKYIVLPLPYRDRLEIDKEVLKRHGISCAIIYAALSRQIGNKADVVRATLLSRSTLHKHYDTALKIWENNGLE